jgi:hypothetical protein
MTKFIKALMITSLILMSVGIASAQTTGSVSGTITDPKGAVVPGATVTIKNTESGSERTATTNDSGAFTIPQVGVGNYAVTVTATGFKKVVVPDAKVNVSVDTTLTLQLEVGGVTDVVTVTSAQDVVNTTSPSITNIINTRQVVDLPLGDRNPVTLAGLQAGIAVNGTDVRGSTVSGLRQTAVNLTQDGINAMDNFVKTSSFFALNSPSLNATDEFSVTTSNAGAEGGRGAVQVNMVTKAGTNQYHGGGFLQIINEAYNANTYFNNFTHIVKPVLRQHYYGFDIGGPVYFLNFGEGKSKIWDGHNKAFFFFSYEKFVQNRAGTINQTVLTQNARNGVFQYTCPSTSADPNCPANTVKTVDVLNLASNQPFHALNPLMTAHIAQIPLPNNNTGCSTGVDSFNIACFNFNALEATQNDKYVVRYDHQLFNNTRLGSHKLEFVWSRVITGTHPDVFTNGLEAPFPGGVDGFQASFRNLVTPALVSNFGTHITNTLRYGRQWAPTIFDRNSFPTKPFISLPGVLTNYDNTFLAQPRNTIVNQITDTLADVQGNHLFKFGGDFQNVLGISRNDAGIVELVQLGTNSGNQNNITLANFPGLTNNAAGNAIVTNAGTVYNAIVGLLGTASQTFNVSSPTSGFVPGATRLRLVQEKDLALFGQDQWRVRSNMTLTGGVRWDYMGVPTVPNGLAIQPSYQDMYGISGFGNLFKPTAAPGSQTQGVATQRFVSGTTGIGLYKNDWNNFAPSVGIAWQPMFKHGVLKTIFGGEGQSSIRAGYSISYLHDGVTTFTNLLGTGTTNPGLIQTATQSTNACGANCPSNVLVGQLNAVGVTMLTPTFTLPITDRQNFLVSSSNGLWTADPHLRSPYVHEWNIGFEREIMKDMALEVRYVGNYEPNAWRTENINEVNIFENGFLGDFLKAQNNLAICSSTAFAAACKAAQAAAGASLSQQTTSNFANWGLPGQVPTPILDKFFTGLTGFNTSGYASSGFVSNLNNNNVGSFANTLAFSTTYRTNRESTTVGLPGNFFVANPNAAFSNILENGGKSWYNAMEVELRKRFSHGLQFQADYTWSKAMLEGDAQGNNQADTANPLTFRNLSLDHRRSSADQTQRFVANAVYDLPVGKGKAFLGGSSGIVDKVIGHWTLGTIATFSTGVPFYITSGRTTFNNSTAGQGAQLTGISFADFKKNVGLFKVPGGTLFINPAILDLTFCTQATFNVGGCKAIGAITSSKLKANLMSAPAPGTFGNFPYLSLNGPSYFDLDMSLTKRIPITERVRFEFKVTALNVLNRAAFTGPGSQTFDSTQFGVISAQKNNARSMNFIGQLRF